MGRGRVALTARALDGPSGRQTDPRRFVAGPMRVTPGIIPRSCGLVLLTLAAASAAGCGPPLHPEQLRQQVLEADPDFTRVLERRDEQANRIKLLEREFQLKRREAERQIVHLRDQLRQTRTQVDGKIAESRQLLQPDIDRIEHALAMAAEERKSLQAQRASVGRRISQLRKALKQTPTDWDQAERTRLATQLDELLQEVKRLDQERAAIAQHLRLLKVKRLLLRV